MGRKLASDNCILQNARIWSQHGFFIQFVIGQWKDNGFDEFIIIIRLFWRRISFYRSDSECNLCLWFILMLSSATYTGHTLWIIYHYIRLPSQILYLRQHRRFSRENLRKESPEMHVRQITVQLQHHFMINQDDQVSPSVIACLCQLLIAVPL